MLDLCDAPAAVRHRLEGPVLTHDHAVPAPAPGASGERDLWLDVAGQPGDPVQGESRSTDCGRPRPDEQTFDGRPPSDVVEVVGSNPRRRRDGVGVDDVFALLPPDAVLDEPTDPTSIDADSAALPYGEQTLLLGRQVVHGCGDRAEWTHA
jgi:hypothetical protein